MKRKLLVLMVCGMLLAFLVGSAQAICSQDYTFKYISGDVNNAPQLTHMLVTDDYGLITPPSGTDVGFKFTTNVDPGAIVGIGFYDGITDDITAGFLDGATASLLNGTGVAFVVDIPPVNIPGAAPGGYFDGQADVFFSASADNPQVTNGVGSGEELWIFFNLAEGKDCEDVIGALRLALVNDGPYTGSNPFPDGGLAVAIKIAGLPGSTEGVNVPLPPSVLLMGSGLLGLGLVGWRRRKKA